MCPNAVLIESLYLGQIDLIWSIYAKYYLLILNAANEVI